jgi:GH24 family phage-related lysozyme (muramidase)
MKMLAHKLSFATLFVVALLAMPAAPALAQTTDSAAPNAIAASRQSLSDRGLSFIERHEGFVDHLYNDSNGNCTIGYGHLLHHGGCNSSDRARYPHGISRAQARNLLRADVGVAERAVRADVQVRLNQHQFDALVSFTFNIGTNAFRSSTLLRLLNQGHYSQVPAQMMRWTIGGLESRRRDEVRLWKYGQYT